MASSVVGDDGGGVLGRGEALQGLEVIVDGGVALGTGGL